MGNWHSWPPDFIIDRWAFYLPKRAPTSQGDLSVRNATLRQRDLPTSGLDQHCLGAVIPLRYVKESSGNSYPRLGRTLALNFVELDRNPAGNTSRVVGTLESGRSPLTPRMQNIPRTNGDGECHRERNQSSQNRKRFPHCFPTSRCNHGIPLLYLHGHGPRIPRSSFPHRASS